MGRRTTVLLTMALLLALGWFFKDRFFASSVTEEDPIDDSIAVKPAPVRVLEGAEHVRQELLAAMVINPLAGFPGTLSWTPLQQSSQKGMFPLEIVLHYFPMTFLEMCLERYDREIEGYTVLFHKRERVNGKLPPKEKEERIEVCFREKPFSVFFNWQKNPGQAQRILYIENAHNGKMLCRPAGLLGAIGVVTRDVAGAEAKRSGRYTIDQFGLKFATERTLESMVKARPRGALHLAYEGVFLVPEIGDRPCYKFVRKPYDPPEEEGVNELIYYIDQENWLQVGSILKDTQGHLIAEYYFSDLQLNPTFKTGQFERGVL